MARGSSKKATNISIAVAATSAFFGLAATWFVRRRRNAKEKRLQEVMTSRYTVEEVLNQVNKYGINDIEEKSQTLDVPSQILYLLDKYNCKDLLMTSEMVVMAI